MTEHEAPLHLRAGSDRRLDRLGKLTALLAAAAVLFGNGGWQMRLVLGFMLTLTWLWIVKRNGKPGPGRIVLLSDGRCQIDNSNARLAGVGWLTRWYCVLVCAGASGTQKVLISASRQDANEYRKLMAWMRLRNIQSD